MSDDKLLKGSDTLKQAYPKINNAISRIDNIASQAGDDNTEIVDARYSATKNKTFDLLSERLDEAEQDTAENSNKIGALNNLNTNDKSNLVNAINENESRLTTLENNINSPEYTPEIYNTSSVFTVGQGTDENGNALDYSDSIVNGQVSDVEIEGRTLKNELNYNNETWEEWVLDDGVVGDSTGLEFTADGSYKNAKLHTNLKSNTKYVIFMNVLYNDTYGFCVARDNDYDLDSPIVISDNFTGYYKKIFNTGDIVNNQLFMFVYNYVPAGKKIKIKDLRVFELPQGSEIEWDFENLSADKLAQKYPYIQGDSTKSTVCAIRIRSRNKNCFDGNMELGTLDGTGQEMAHDTVKRTANYLRVKGNTRYRISKNNLAYSVNIFEYDINRNFLRVSYGSDLTTLRDTAYLKFRDVLGDGLYYDMYQIEEDNTVTEYEEYKESTMYLYAEDEEGNTIKLNSLPNGVKDKIKVINGKYVVEKSTEEYILQASDITNLWTQYTTFDWVSIKKPTEYKYYGLNTFNSTEIEGSIIINSDLFKTTGVFNELNPSIGSLFNNGATGLGLIIPKGTYTDLSSAQADLAGTAIIYQLAEPKYYELKGVTPLQVFKNGTVYIEPFLRKAIKYDATNGNGFDFPIKISGIEKIEDINGNELDLESVTLATDGMSATCTTANEGEVYTVYAYIDSAENVTPTTAMKFPINSKAQIEGNNKAIQTLRYDVFDLQDQVAILMVINSN